MQAKSKVPINHNVFWFCQNKASDEYLNRATVTGGYRRNIGDRNRWS